MIPTLLAGLAMVGASHGSPAIDALVSQAWADDEAQVQIDAKRQAELDEDKKNGKKYSEQADKELKISKDAAMLERITKIGNELATVANRTRAKVTWGDIKPSAFDYTFKLVEDKDVNAFSLPGGFIYVNDGLVKYCESDDELAGVLAHEIAHAALRHIWKLEREQSKLMSVQLPLILIGILTGAAAEGITTAQLLSQAKGSGWSVQAEEAADFAGFQYMLKSKYNPTGMLTVMERLAKDEMSKPSIDWGIFRTHPPGRERAEAMMKFMRESGSPIRRSEVASSFRATAKPTDTGAEVLFGSRHIVNLGGPDAVTRAEAAATRLNGFFDSMPELYDLSSGDQGRIMGDRETLLTLTQADAQALNKTQRDLQTEALKNLRIALFNMAYRVWDVR